MHILKTSGLNHLFFNHRKIKIIQKQRRKNYKRVKQKDLFNHLLILLAVLLWNLAITVGVWQDGFKCTPCQTAPSLSVVFKFNLVAPKIFEYNVLAKLKDSINAWILTTSILLYALLYAVASNTSDLHKLRIRPQMPIPLGLKCSHHCHVSSLPSSQAGFYFFHWWKSKQKI